METEFRGIKVNVRSEQTHNEWVDHIEEVVRDAAKAFVQAAVSYDLIPVDTGMSKGAYLNLGALLGISVPINPKTHKRPMIYNPYKGARKMPKTPQSGAALSDYVFSRTDTEVKFMFSTEVYQYVLNDFAGGVNPNPDAPWGSFQAGHDAFMEYFNEHIGASLPSINFFLGIENE